MDCVVGDSQATPIKTCVKASVRLVSQIDGTKEGMGGWKEADETGDRSLPFNISQAGRSVPLEAGTRAGRRYGRCHHQALA